MEPEIISDDQGEIFRLISKIKTTPHTNDLPKNVYTDSSTIEVLIFDAIMTAVGSQFGHVAIDVDGTIYSRAHSKYAEINPGSAFRESNQRIRNFEGLTLRVSQKEKTRIKTELVRRVKLDRPYSIIENSCSTNIADVLESIGILAHDPRFQLDPESTNLVSPKEILIIVSRSKRVSKRTHYMQLKNEK